MRRRTHVRPFLLLTCAVVAITGTVATATYFADRPENPQRIPHHAGELLVVNFAHADHSPQDCIACHHNFVDDTGVGLCFDCHKSDAEIAGDIETHFHDLCRGCHVDEQAKGSEHGPTRACIDCHVADDRP